ncbi:MAG: electron transfer flavoprotein subunit alpha/FixB family protein [Elusimicrobia bacterium]|nr:electron transfer flavoprotein subunit alpha/FixB family protein [Elusimicrobiota bacterium]
MAEYRDIWVFCEQRNGRFENVSLEMLGEARRLMDKYNVDYNEQESVVAVVLGHNIEHLVKEALGRGADRVYAADHSELKDIRMQPYTKIIANMSRQKDAHKNYDKPRYFLFPATNNGRDLSSTVLAELESGLASDCNKLYIKETTISHRAKTDGTPRVFYRILHMKRPDFSGYEWSTILCLDSPKMEYSPQACSVIPGSFKPLPFQENSKGEIVRYQFDLAQQDLLVTVTGHEKIPNLMDLTGHDVIVSAGRGIGKNPTEGLRLCIELARLLGGEMGLSRGVCTAKYTVEPAFAQYVTEARQIGETGQTVKPKLYIAVGISGAIQHKKGMDQSEFIVAINTDPMVPIHDFADVFIQGDLFEVLPQMIEQIKTGKKLEVVLSGGKV